GIINQEILPKYFSKVLYAVIVFSAWRDNPGVFGYRSKGIIFLGTVDNILQPIMEKISKIMSLGISTKISEKISSKYKTLVICGDITTRVDADRIEEHNVETVQINTGRECALNAYHINQIIKNKDLTNYDVIFIENVGNLICPSEFTLGTDKRIIVVSITEGEWVIEKHPMLFKMSDIAIINKIDLLERLGTDIDKMISDAKNYNPKIEVITTSAKTGENINKLIEMLGL
ncbi:unnamed protein product, partial [marine sediment metagenome]